MAAIRAGYSEKNARNTGSRMLTNANIITAMQKSMEAREKRTEITQDMMGTTREN